MSLLSLWYVDMHLRSHLELTFIVSCYCNIRLLCRRDQKWTGNAHVGIADESSQVHELH
jgi:hypothetical protein